MWEEPEAGPLEVQERVATFREALAWARERSDQIIVTLPFDGGQYWAGRGDPQPPKLPPWDWKRFPE